MASGHVEPEERRVIFDRWAAGYDRSVAETAHAEDFPFAGYDRVLEAMCVAVEPTPGRTVLDLGTGTGALARRLLDRGCNVTGTDLSSAMLDEARVKVPEATLVCADLLGDWPPSIDGPFDRVVSAYVLHEFPLDAKIAILTQAARRLDADGRIIVGDVAFDDVRARDDARTRWHHRWDHDEHYWAADEALEAATRAGLSGHWRSVSACAGVFVFRVAL